MNKNITPLILIVSIIIQSCSPTAPKVSSSLTEADKKAEILELVQNATFLLELDSKKHAKRAYSYLALAEEIDPQSSLANDALGCYYFAQGEFEKAQEYFFKALSYDTQNSKAYSHMAEVAVIKGDYAEAKALYVKSLAIDPLNHRARNNLAVLIAEEDGKPELAKLELLKAQNTTKVPDKILTSNLSAIE